MSELGTGAGSSYPSALDTNNKLEYDKTSVNKTLARSDVINDLADAIINIETELGLNISGDYTTLLARLEGMPDIIVLGSEIALTVADAITALSSTRKTIFVPPGNWIFSATITIPYDGVTIYGCGESSRLYTTTTTINGITINSKDGCRFHNFKLEGPSAGNYSGIYLTGSSMRTLIGQGMYITGWGLYSIEEDDSSTTDYNIVIGNILNGNTMDPSVHFRVGDDSQMGVNIGG